MIGETVSHYRVLSRLGSGGMGDVYLAEDTRLGRNVALKTLKRTCCTTEARARLLREARVLSQLNHPGIAVVYDVGERLSPDGDEGFLAMEYVAGETLEAAVARGRLPVEDAVRLTTDVAEALGAAHARGVVHRDVKPGNVMVDGEGRVKVLDFGLALEAPRAGVDPQAETIDEGKMTTESLSRGIVGTVAYMSPEQARGRPLDARTDVFSLGVVLYQLLSGRLPFRGANVVEQLDALLNLDPEPLAATNDAVPPSLDAVVRKMLEKDRERRHADMKSVARDLAAALSGKATSAAGAPPSGNTVAVMGFRNITGESEDDWLGTGISETVTADLQGVPGLVVIGRERIFEVARKVGGKASDPDERLALAVGREVGARWVVCGGYQRVGAQIRLTARVLDAPSGALLHTVKLDGPIERIFELQDRIVRELSCCWRVEPEPASPVVEEGETHVIAAYEAFAKGMINLRAETRDALDRAILFFERAVQLDPRYARAHQRLGSAFDLKATYLVMPELLERAVAAYRRSLELDPASAETWRELGSTQVALGQEDEALVSIRKALALDPTSASAHGTLGRAFLIGRGEFRNARASFERAVELNPQAGWFWLQLSHTTALLGDLATAGSAAHRAITLQEEFLSGREGAMIVGAYVRLGHAHALSGRYEDALLEYERELGFLRRVDHALKDRVLVELDVRIGSAHRRLAQHEAAGNALRRAVRAFEERLRLGVDDPFTRYYATVAWALLGEDETALASLAKTVEMKPRFTRSRARVEPDFEKLRDRAPFRALIGE